MKRLKSPIARAGAFVLALALLAPVETVAQSQGDGVSNFLNNLFKPGGSAQQPQAATGTTGPLPWTGEDGAYGRASAAGGAVHQLIAVSCDESYSRSGSK